MCLRRMARLGVGRYGDVVQAKDAFGALLPLLVWKMKVS